MISLMYGNTLDATTEMAPFATLRLRVELENKNDSLLIHVCTHFYSSGGSGDACKRQRDHECEVDGHAFGQVLWYRDSYMTPTPTILTASGHSHGVRSKSRSLDFISYRFIFLIYSINNARKPACRKCSSVVSASITP